MKKEVLFQDHHYEVDLPYCTSRQETKTKTKQFEKTITNPLKHVANCRATSSYKTLAEALETFRRNKKPAAPKCKSQIKKYMLSKSIKKDWNKKNLLVTSKSKRRGSVLALT